jgi:hypothetical protein
MWLVKGTDKRRLSAPRQKDDDVRAETDEVLEVGTTRFLGR